MSKPFVLSAEVNLQATNVAAVVSSIKKQLGAVSFNVNLKIDPRSAAGLDTINNKIKTLTANLKEAHSAANSLNSAISRSSYSFSSTQQRSLATAITNTNKLKSSVSAVNNEFAKFGAQSALTLRRVAAYSIAGGSIYGLISALKSGIGQAISFDKEMVRLSQVTGSSLQNLKGLSSEVTRLSTGLGVNSKELIDVTSTLAQAGLTAGETKKALDGLAKSSLAPSFENMNQTVEGSIAILQQFNLKTKDLESVLGSVNKVAADFAVESRDIVSAVKIAGAAFSTASHGIADGKEQLNQFISLFTSVRQTTRESAESIATGLRTIFTRIERPKTIEYLKQYGIQLTDLQGKFVGPYEAARRLSQGLSELDDRDLKKFQIYEELGGYRNLSRTIPLINQFAVAEKALGIAHEGTASLAKDAATAQQSLSVQITRVREEFLALTRDLVESKGFKELSKFALTAASTIIKVVDSLKVLAPYIAALGTIKLAGAALQFGKGFLGNVGKGSKFFAGGSVPGSGNSDTVPAMLTPGEFVINKQAASQIGYSKLHSINSSPTQHFADGGVVHPSGWNSIGSDNREQKYSKAINRYYNYILGKYGINLSDIRTTASSYTDKTLPHAAGTFYSFNSIKSGKIRISPSEFANRKKYGKDIAVPMASKRRTDTLLHELVHALDFYIGGDNFISSQNGHYRKIATNKNNVDSIISRMTLEGHNSDDIKKYANHSSELLVHAALNDKKLFHSLLNDAAFKTTGRIVPNNMGIFSARPKPFDSGKNPFALSSNLGQESYGPLTKKDWRKQLVSNQILNKSVSGLNRDKFINGYAGGGVIRSDGTPYPSDYHLDKKSRIVRRYYNQILKNQGLNLDDLSLGVFVRPPSPYDNYESGNDTRLIINSNQFRNKNNRKEYLLKSLFGKLSNKKVSGIQLATGGMVPGQGIGDTVPAMLSPGEFVIKKDSAQKIGYNNLHAMNSQKFAQGGRVSDRKYQLYQYARSLGMSPSEAQSYILNIGAKKGYTQNSLLPEYNNINLAGEFKNRGDRAAYFANHINSLSKIKGGNSAIRDLADTGMNRYGFTPTELFGISSEGTQYTSSGLINNNSSVNTSNQYSAFKRKSITKPISKFGSYSNFISSGFKSGPLTQRSGFLLGAAGAGLSAYLGDATNEHAAGLHGAIQGAAGGAFLGANLGPLGLAAGVVGGAALGHIDSQQSFLEKNSFQNLEKNIQKLDEAFENINRNGGLIKFNKELQNTVKGAERVNDVRSNKFNASGSSNSLLGSGFGIGTAFGSSSTRSASRAIDELGYITYLFSSSRDAVKAEDLSKRKEALSNADVFKQAAPSALSFVQGKFQQGESVEELLKNKNIVDIFSGKNDEFQDFKLNQKEYIQRLKEEKHTINSTISQDEDGGNFSEDEKKKYFPTQIKRLDAISSQIEKAENSIAQKKRETASQELKDIEKLELAQKKLKDAFQASTVASEQLVSQFIKIASVVERVSSESEAFNSKGQFLSGQITGSTNIPHLPGSNVFGNSGAYSTKEISQHIKNLGLNDEQTESLSQNFIGEKLIKEELGDILKNYRGTRKFSGPEEAVGYGLDTLESVHGNKFSDEMRESILSKFRRAEGDEAKQNNFSISEFAKQNSFANHDTLEGRGATEALEKIERSLQSALQKYVDGINHYTQLYIQASEKQLDADELITRQELDILKLLGKEPSIETSYSPVRNRIQSLTGGTIDANEIYKNITSLQSHGENLFNQQKEAEANKTGNLGEAARLTDLIAKNNIELNKNNQALKILATDTTKLAAITQKLAEEQQNRQEARNVFDRLLGASPQEAQKIFRENASYEKVSKGGGIGNFEEYNFALAGLRNRQSVTFDKEKKEQLEVDFRRKVAEQVEKGGITKELKQLFEYNKTGIGGSGKEQGLLEEAKKANKNQVNAAQKEADLAGKDLPKFLANLGNQLGDFLNNFGKKKIKVDINPNNNLGNNIKAAAIKDNNKLDLIDLPHFRNFRKGIFKPGGVLGRPLPKPPSDKATSVRIGNTIYGGKALDDIRSDALNGRSTDKISPKDILDKIKAADDAAAARRKAYDDAKAQNNDKWFPPIQKQVNNFNNAATKFANAAQQLNNIRIPERIEIAFNAVPNININIMGINGLKETVTNEVLDAVMQHIKRHVYNPLTGETKEGLG